MAPESPHVIRKAALEVNAASGDAFRLQQEAVSWARDTLVPALEEAFASLPDTGEHVVIDRLELLVDAGDPSQWTQEAMPRLKAGLAAALARSFAEAGAGVERVPAGRGFLRKLAFYLERGFLPWNLAASTPAELLAQAEAWIDAEPPDAAAGLSALWRSPAARLRFLQAFPAAFTTRLLNRIFGMPQDLTASWSRDAGRISVARRRAASSADRPADMPRPLLQEILLALSHSPRIFAQGVEEEIVHAYLLRAVEGSTPRGRSIASEAASFESAAFRASWDRILRKLPDAGTRPGSPCPAPGSPVPDVPSPVQQSRPRDSRSLPGYDAIDNLAASAGAGAGTDSVADSDLTILTGPKPAADPALEGLYVPNAGLILVAPFLGMLFERLELARDGGIRDPAMAVALLHFLATGEEAAVEFQAPLAKVLCGLPLDTALALPAALPESLKAEGIVLLESAIGHWAILKDTSVAGLREGFLQRKGKLTRRPGGDWLLQVEQKAYDMLLEHLPWSYQFVRLPWMENHIRTEWME